MKIFEYLSCFHNNTTDKTGTNEYYSLKHNLFISEKAINTSREKRTSILKTDSLAAVKNMPIESKTVKKVTISDKITIIPKSIYGELIIPPPPPPTPESIPVVIGFETKYIIRLSTQEFIKKILEDSTIIDSIFDEIQEKLAHHNNIT